MQGVNAINTLDIEKEKKTEEKKINMRNTGHKSTDVNTAQHREGQ